MIRIQIISEGKNSHSIFQQRFPAFTWGGFYHSTRKPSEENILAYPNPTVKGILELII
jgi:hypothetical protein